MKHSLPEEIHIVLHNRFGYDYHLIIKELAEEFEKQFTFLGQKTEKHITFSVPILKEVGRINKNWEEFIKDICIIQIIIYW